MRIPGKMFGKICLKAFRNTFFPNMWSVIRGGKKGLTFWWKVISNRRGKFKLLGLQGELPPSPSPLVRHPNFPIRKILRRVLGLLTMFLENVSVRISFKATNLQHVRLKIEKKRQILQSIEGYPSISK